MENIFHIVLGTVRQLYYIMQFYILQLGADQHDDSYVSRLTHGTDVLQNFHGLDGYDVIGNGRSGGHHHGNHLGGGNHGHLGYGVEDVDSHVENLEEDVQPVMVPNHHKRHHGNHHGQNHDFEPNFKFNYPTYEIPVHGDVVSEKDAKKIGKFLFNVPSNVEY